MKKELSLLAVAMLTASGTGCNCCPCLRNICPFGSCGSLCRPAETCPPAPVATYAAVPASPCAPAPVYAATPMATPVFAATPQQYTVPQYAAPVAQPVYSEAGCGASYAAESSCGVAYTVADPGCCSPCASPCGCDVGYGAPTAGQMMVDPAPAP